MRAKLINEKFVEDSDPIKDMDIGWNLDKYIEKKEKQLEYEPGSFHKEFEHKIWKNPRETLETIMFMLSKMPIEYQREFIDDFFMDVMYLSK